MDLTMFSVNAQFVEMGFFSLRLARSWIWSTGALWALHFGRNPFTHVAAGKSPDRGCQSIGEQLKTVWEERMQTVAPLTVVNIYLSQVKQANLIQACHILQQAECRLVYRAPSRLQILYLLYIGVDVWYSLWGVAFLALIYPVFRALLHVFVF